MAFLHKNGTVTFDRKKVIGYWTAHIEFGYAATEYQGCFKGKPDSPRFFSKDELRKWFDDVRAGIAKPTPLEELIKLCTPRAEKPINPVTGNNFRVPRQILARPNREGADGTVAGEFIDGVNDPLHDNHYIQTALVRAALIQLGVSIPTKTQGGE